MSTTEASSTYYRPCLECGDTIEIIDGTAEPHTCKPNEINHVVAHAYWTGHDRGYRKARDEAKQQLWDTYGPAAIIDGTEALAELGNTNLQPDDVLACRYRDQAAADAYATFNLVLHGLPRVGSYTTDGGVVGVTDLRPAQAERDARLRDS